MVRRSYLNIYDKYGSVYSTLLSAGTLSHLLRVDLVVQLATEKRVWLSEPGDRNTPMTVTVCTFECKYM